MKNLLFTTVLLIIISISAFAGNQGYEKIKSDYLAGKISYENYTLQRFYYGFDQSRLDSRYFDQEKSLLKCGTETVQEFYKNKSKLSAEAIKIIESFLHPVSDAPRSVYISPYGKFQFTYETSGTNAVPAADLNSNGVPDYVEWCANYMDYSWKYEIDTLGNLAPPIGGGLYQVSFENMEYYGYTQPTGGALTEIVLHNTFIGFPSNTDPEGNQKGAAKVTCAHEFKHAIQIVYNDWNEPGWFIEMDATWMEDYAYDYVNDYYNYLPSSQITSPGRRFEQGSGYEDCLWLHSLTQRFGVNLNKDIWMRRKTNPGENVYFTFDYVLNNQSSNLVSAFKEYFTWNAFTGTRTYALVRSYKEASKYPTASICRQHSIPDTASGCSINGYSSNILYFTGINSDKFLQISYHGDQYAAQTIQAMVLYKNNTSQVIDLNTDNQGNIFYVLQKPLADVSSVTLIPIIVQNVSGSFTYTYNVKPYLPAAFNFSLLKDVETSLTRNVKIKVTPETGNAVMDSLKLYYKTGSSALTYVKMNTTGIPNEYSAVISAFPMDTRVYYYFSIYDNVAHTVYYPDSAPLQPFSYYIGVDNQAPSIALCEVSAKTRFEFPFNLFASVNDNMAIDSFYVEYKVNNGSSVRKDFQFYKDTVYFTKITIDTTVPLNSFSYRITAVDASTHKNRSLYPANGTFQNVIVEDAKKYVSESNKFIAETIFGIKDTVTVTDDINIKDIKLFFKAEHNRASDLLLLIIPPFGAASQIMKNPGAGTSFENLKNPEFMLNDAAYLTLNPFGSTDSVYMTGEYKPDTTKFTYFADHSAKGNWVLIVRDTRTDETGYLKKWGLIVTPKTAAAINDSRTVPSDFALFQNYPNPFNPSTKIRYYLPVRSEVTIKVYNVLGKEVFTLVNAVKETGFYETELNADAAGLSSGVYFYKINAGNYTSVKKLTLIK